MFQWKNLELSPEDYENYVYNEDETQMKINCANITEQEWCRLYEQIQQKSINNKKIKKYILAYENNLKRLLVHLTGDIQPKELHQMYQKHSNQFRMQISGLFDQIGLLHIRNISTTVEFSISRLLSLEDLMVKTICQKQSQIDDLEQVKNSYQFGKTTQLCASCFQEIQKNRNKFLIKQIMAVEESSNQMEELQRKELTETERHQKKMKQQSRKEERQYEIQRFYYLNSVEQVLKNRQKTLKCNSAPLQNLLSDYLTQILGMLQESKFSFTPKNLRQYDRVNKSYETVDDMKQLINSEDFYKKVTLLIEKPYQNLVENIERYINRSTQNKSILKATVQTQTVYLTEFNQIKNLEKSVTELSTEMEYLKHSKNKNEMDLISNLESLHKLEMKYVETINRNKTLQSQNKKLEGTIVELRTQIKLLQAKHKSDQASMIEINANQKSCMLKEIKHLQLRLRYYESREFSAFTKSTKQIQTEGIQQSKATQTNQNAERQLRKMLNRKSQKKDKKRISLRMQEMRLMKMAQTQSSKFSNDKKENINDKGQHTKENSLLDPNHFQRNESRTKTIKIYTINPLSPLNDKLIHRGSSRKLSSSRVLKAKQSDIAQIQGIDSNRLSTNNNDMPRIKKVSQKSMKHSRNVSQLKKGGKHRKQQSNVQNLSIVTGKRILGQNSMEDTQLNLESVPLLNKQPSIQYLNNQDQNFIVKINHPQTIKQSSRQYMTTLQQNAELMSKPGYKEQLSKFIKFSINNFESLIEKNIIGMICDLRFNRKVKIVSKKQEKVRDSISVAENQTVDPTIDVQCSKIGRKCLQIFFNMEEAQKYQNKAGIWSQIDTFIMIDNNFNKFCEKIQLFFDELKDTKPMLYQQSLLFLEKPYYFCQQVEGKDYETKQITIFRQSLMSFNVQRNWIKKLFMKLLRLHKLIHKNCHHVQKFLQIIGFYRL